MSGAVRRRVTSGERFEVEYLLNGASSLEEAQARAWDICLEQTVELPDDLVARGPIRDEVVGRIEHIEPALQGRWRATVSFAVETAAGELTQLLNVVFGNVSLNPAFGWSGSCSLTMRWAFPDHVSAGPGCAGW